MLRTTTTTTPASGGAGDGAKADQGLRVPASSDAASSAVLSPQSRSPEADERSRWLQQQLIAIEMRLALAGLIPIVAHEVNNALTVLLGNVQLVEQVPRDEDTAALLNRVVEEAHRITRVVRNLLTFSQDSSNGPVYVDVNVLITNILELLAYDFRVSNIELETRLEPNLPPTIGNAAQLRYLFFHLIGSFRERLHSNNRPARLSIHTASRGEMLEISISDGGTGVSSRTYGDLRVLEGELCDPRSDLFLCAQVAGQCQGRLWVDSHPMRGVAYYVELPVANWPAHPLTSSAAVLEERPIGSRILVADDERDIAGLVARGLESEGYRVDTVQDGNAALERLRTRKYDLVLLNLRMPGADGEMVYRYLKAISPSLARRVIFLTGDTGHRESRAFLESTGNPYIAKPFALEELKTLVFTTLVANAESL